MDIIMNSKNIITAIGIMTGTSLDGADIGCIRTDGKHHIEYLGSNYLPFHKELSDKIRGLINGSFTIKQYRLIEKEYTEFCYSAMVDLLERYEVDLIGFHGQTLFHSPSDFITHQMGYAKYLEKLSQTEVISDFRTDDILAGGQGAPLVPLFHKAIVKDKPPFAILNIGGVSNITYFGEDVDGSGDANSLSQKVIAFDIGPGCAKLNDIARQYYETDYDQDGRWARSGRIHTDLVYELLLNKYFAQTPPKSLDRNHFDYQMIKDLLPEDQLATVSSFVAKSIIDAYKFLPKPPKVTYLCGGGRHNKFVIDLLKEELNIKMIDDLGLDGDMIEAYAFAYLAARRKFWLYAGTI